MLGGKSGSGGCGMKFSNNVFLKEENPDLVASSLQFPFPAGCRNKSHLESCTDSLFPYITSLHAPTTTQ